MNGSSEAEGEDQPELVPFLPDAPAVRPAAPIVTPRDPATAHADATVGPAPYVPEPSSPPPPASQPPEQAFDAKAMVESQKSYRTNPSYGSLPTGTEASREAAQELRDKARRKRQRNRRLGWLVAVMMLGGVVAAGWFGFQAYQDDQDERAAERAEAQLQDEGDDPVAATPIGEQVEVVEAMEDLNSITPGNAGGLLGAVEDARDLVGQPADEPVPAPIESGPAAEPALGSDAFLPQIVIDLGERLPDLTGRETYSVRVEDFSAGDPQGYADFVRFLSTRPQLSPDSPVFAELPPTEAGMIVISIERTDDELLRAIVRAESPGIHVDYAP